MTTILFAPGLVKAPASFGEGILPAEPPAREILPSIKPTTGRGLYAAACEATQMHEHDFVKDLARWGRQHDLTCRIVNWPADAIAEGYEALCELVTAFNAELDADAEAAACQARLERGLVFA